MIEDAASRADFDDQRGLWLRQLLSG